MDHQKFVIESSEAETMAKKQGLNSVHQLLPLIVKSARNLAQRPISGFAVAAAGLASDGRVFIGVNVEFPKLPLHHSIHAEQFLITNLSRYPNVKITNVVVSAYPCGHCRQFLQEIRHAHDIQLFVLQGNGEEELVQIASGDSGNVSQDYFRPLSEFLPHRFGPDDLLDKDVPLILESHENGLVLVDDLINNGQNGTSFCFNPKIIALDALDAANRSHAPYSGCPSGMAMVDNEGNVFKGSYMESAAYNPSLGPAQAAVIDYMASTTAEFKSGDQVGFGNIIGAVLVEKEGAIVRQEETVRLFLKVVAPKCEFHVYHCKDSRSHVNGNIAIPI